METVSFIIFVCFLGWAGYMLIMVCNIATAAENLLKTDFLNYADRKSILKHLKDLADFKRLGYVIGVLFFLVGLSADNWVWHIIAIVCVGVGFYAGDRYYSLNNKLNKKTNF